MKKITVRDVCDFFIALAQDAGEQLTHMKLQKLLYYAQAWHCGMFGRPLFDAKFEAWKFGPVCPEIYCQYKTLGNANIPFIGEHDEKEGCLSGVAESFSPETLNFLNDIARDYMKYTAFQLSAMTHKEKPWKEHAAAAEEIPVKEMIYYYGSLVLTPEEEKRVIEAENDIMAGKGIIWKPRSLQNV
ncbi:MAG: DUF4065 domain-containing protein [Acidaminococcales bacterium]|jgi:uncharacterized phage-associated protein|nr:DUF4065 domain-containing protein [Acidaminococcales bacterium]